MVKRDQALLQTKPLSIHSLYDAYAGMLLGYIFEVVKDKKTAEDYLVKTFSTIAAHFNDINWAETNKWCLLQRFAKSELTAFNEIVKSYKTTAEANYAGSLPNKYLNKMSDEQKFVFCNIYYSKKTTAQLANETNKSEETVKQSLKEAFAIIRTTNGN
jgi:DNA-directed RNA polymerase specialized sigma24 family protein